MEWSWSSVTGDITNSFIHQDSGWDGYGSFIACRNPLCGTNIHQIPAFLKVIDKGLVQQLQVVDAPGKYWLVYNTLQCHI